jgi:hypothetical protein
MGLFGPYVYKTKSGQKFFLHMKEKGKTRLYYFSKESVGALNSLPRGYEVMENTASGLPFMKKKTIGGLFSVSPTKPTAEKTEEKSAEEKPTT